MLRKVYGFVAFCVVWLRLPEFVLSVSGNSSGASRLVSLRFSSPLFLELRSRSVPVCIHREIVFFIKAKKGSVHVRRSINRSINTCCTTAKEGDDWWQRLRSRSLPCSNLKGEVVVLSRSFATSINIARCTTNEK